MGIELSEFNKLQLWIPEGFAHGFVVTSEIADFQYKCTNFYSPEDEGSIHWNDPDLGIVWPSNIDISVSKKILMQAHSKQLSKNEYSCYRKQWSAW